MPDMFNSHDVWDGHGQGHNQDEDEVGGVHGSGHVALVRRTITELVRG